MTAVSALASPAHDTITWGTTDLRFECRCTARRKSLAITVHPDLRIVVTAPNGTPAERIRSAVHKRARWIVRTRRGFEQFHPLQPPRAYVPGETHRYLGRQCRLKVVQGAVEGVKLGRGELLVTVTGKPVPANIRPLVERWLEERANESLGERLHTCHRAASRFRIPLPPLQIRALATRWGSCTRGGRIVLNRELIKAPSDCIDYVITHELCHLLEPNHNARFWQLLDALMPDWQERRGRLNRLADL